MQIERIVIHRVFTPQMLVGLGVFMISLGLWFKRLYNRAIRRI